MQDPYFRLMSYPTKWRPKCLATLRFGPELQKGIKYEVSGYEYNRINLGYLLRVRTRMFNVARRDGAICHTVLAISLVKSLSVSALASCFSVSDRPLYMGGPGFGTQVCIQSLCWGNSSRDTDAGGTLPLS